MGAVKAIVILSDRLPKVKEIKDEDVKQIVGGYFEGRTIGKHVMYMHEDGKVMGFALNPIATRFLKSLDRIVGSDYVVGNVVIMGVGNDGESVDVSRDLEAAVMRLTNEAKPTDSKVP